MTTHPTERSAPADHTPVTFHDHLLPGIGTGRYRITVDQQLPSGDLPGAAFDPVRQIVDVRAARFRLDPSWVHAVHPAPHSQGPFADLLPHITLTPAALPWEREPFTGGTGVPARSPWLALLLFGEGELPGDPNALGAPAMVTVRELLAGDATVTGPSLGADAVDPALLDTSCHIVDVPRDLLAQLLPSPAELPFLAHVRAGGEDAPSSPDQGTAGPGDQDAHAVVTAARFPGTGRGRYVAHLVSLEGHRPPGQAEGGEPVRLVSLHRWTFTSCPASGDGFGRLVERFTPGNGEHSAAPLRPAPLPGAGLDDELTALLDQGMVPMSHVTETGERALAWYSGPFLPRVAPATPRPEGGHFGDADGLLLHEPRTGTFATGYACAWNLGRALALADPGFSTTLVRLRHQGRLRRATDHQYRTYSQQSFLSAPLTSSSGVKKAGLASTAEPMADAPGAPSRAATPREQFEELLRGDALGALADSLGATADAPAAAGPAPVTLTTPIPRTLKRSAAERPPSPDAKEAAAWLAGLRALGSVPFDYLVPDQRMLPPESLRLFHVDRAWLDALLDGARGLDRHPRADRATDAELDALLDAAGPVPAAGLLLRSALVPGWPALRIEALDGSGTAPVEVLRREPLGADVLLLLFDRMPDRLTFGEPRQGLHFGVDDEGRVALRSLSPGEVGLSLGRSLPVTGDAALTRNTPTGARVLDVGALAARLAEHVKPQSSSLTPAEFAVQLVRGPERLSLTFEGTTR
ncbi:hypothetical protein [Streptomyces albireticuli]|uniref:hypothetical protein n=1 Tax=Streptomyces albireticuli TaxID=1940 RepID=UPI00369C17E9